MKHDNFELKFNLIFIVSLLIIIFIAMGLSNASSSDEWNGGICPTCEVRYELRGVYKFLKYYACPECGHEVERY